MRHDIILDAPGGIGALCRAREVFETVCVGELPDGTVRMEFATPLAAQPRDKALGKALGGKVERSASCGSLTFASVAEFERFAKALKVERYVAPEGRGAR